MDRRCEGVWPCMLGGCLVLCWHGPYRVQRVPVSNLSAAASCIMCISVMITRVLHCALDGANAFHSKVCCSVAACWPWLYSFCSDVQCRHTNCTQASWNSGCVWRGGGVSKQRPLKD